MPDSLRREFRTAKGRKEFEFGGIAPDSVVKDEDVGPMVRELIKRALFFKFANAYCSEHKSGKITGVTPSILKEFRAFLDSEKFDYQEEMEGKISDLRQLAERSHYTKDVSETLDRLETTLRKEKSHGFDRYEDHITNELNIELMARLGGDRGRIEASLKDDPQLVAAEGLLKNHKAYAKKLGL